MKRRQAMVMAGGAMVLPALALPAAATDYASPAAVIAEVERLEAEIDARLAAILEAVPRALPFVASVRADRARHRTEREDLRQRLGTIPPAASGPLVTPESLAALRTAQQALVHAHAEGFPALRSSEAVRVMAPHLVDLARQLTVIDLWIEAEDDRG